MKAEEIAEVSPGLYNQIEALLGDINIRLIPHEAFKAQTENTLVFIAAVIIDVYTKRQR